MSNKLNNTGFTIVELLIATAIFSVILLGSTFALIQVSRMYYKGVVSARTQEVARNVIDEISRPLQFQGASLRIDPVPTAINGWDVITKCVGNQRLTYAVGMRADPSLPSGTVVGDRIKHALWKDTLETQFPCVAVDLRQTNPSSGTKGTNGKDMLSDRMRLSRLDVDYSNGIWSTDVSVMYGDRDVMNPDDVTLVPESCKGSSVGGQWCAKSEYKSQVKPRI